MKKNKVKFEEKNQSKNIGNTSKKSEFKPKDWAVKLIEKHKVLIDGLKDR